MDGSAAWNFRKHVAANARSRPEPLCSGKQGYHQAITAEEAGVAGTRVRAASPAAAYAIRVQHYLTRWSGT